MEFLKSIIPDDWYLRFFPPEEDSQEGVKIYLHIREGKYIIPVAEGVSRSQVVEFLKDINSDSSLDQDETLPTPDTDVELGNTRSTEIPNMSDDLVQRLTDLFSLPPKTIGQIIIDTFNGSEILFVGGGEISVEHEKDAVSGIWQTWFTKNIKNEQCRVACINTSKLVKW